MKESVKYFICVWSILAWTIGPLVLLIIGSYFNLIDNYHFMTGLFIYVVSPIPLIMLESLLKKYES